MRLIGLCFFILALVGCQPLSKDQRAFLRLQAEAIACQKQEMSDLCQQKIDKYLLMAQDAQRLQESPQQFGQEILSAQMQLAKLDNMSNTPAVKSEKQKLELKLQRLIQLVAIFESP